MYAKEKQNQKEQKKYVFNKKFSSVQGGKSSRNVKMVDPRLKKDMWREKKAKKGVRGYSKYKK
jgi:hypothetical protein